MLVLAVVSWCVLAGLAAAAVTATFGVSSRKLLALAHDGLPYLLLLAWLILLVSVVERSWALVATAAVLVAYHLALMIPRIRAARAPRWVAHAPHVRLTVANVYVDNAEPKAMADQLVASGADLIVIAEWSDRFGEAFNAADVHHEYPHRLCNDCDDPEYVVTVASRVPLTEDSEVVTVGPLIIAKAVIPCGSRSFTLLAVHLMAMVDRGGYDRWKGQLDALTRYVPTVGGPFVIAGDFNTTRYRPDFQRLLNSGVIDVHDTLGRGLSTSFRLATSGALAAAGTIVRLDHALVSDGVWPVSIRDLDACGSDHIPFTATLAVLPDAKLDAAGTCRPPMSRSDT